MASRELKVEIIGDASSLNKALGSVSNSSSKLGSTLKSMGKLAALGLGALAVGAVAAGKSMVDMASDAAEVDSKMRVVFGKTLPGLTKELDKFAEATGASRFELREQAADMGALLEPLTSTKKGAADMSAQFVKLATDLGSFNNVPVGDALLAIRSGLVGEAEPLRRFGVLLNEAAVKAEAYSSGIAKVGADLTEQQKVQARANLIMEQTTLAQGDATRTAGSAANQFKALKNNLRDAGTEMGAKLLPAVLSIVKAFNENWPQIEKVVDQVMDALISGAGSAVDAVKRNFDTIKATVTVAFNAMKSAAQGFVNFIRSDLGMQLASAAVGMLAVGKAVAILAPAAKLAATAFMLMGKSIGATLLITGPLIVLGALVGTLAGNFIQAKIDAAQLASELSRASDNARQLKDSLDALKQAELSERQAKLNLREAAAGVRDAQAAVNKAYQEYGPSSQQAADATRGLQAALLNLEQANIDVDTATKNHTKAEQARNNELTNTERKVLNVTGSVERFQGVATAQAQLLPKYAAAMKTLGDNAGATAVRLRETDPAASRAAAKGALLAQVAQDLAQKLGRVPSRKEIIAEAKAIKFGPFYAELLKAQSKTKKAMGQIPKEVAAMQGPAGTAAAGIGSAITSGISSGFDFGGVIAIVRAGVRAAIEAGKNAGSLTKDYAAKEIGKPITEGPVEQIKKDAPKLAEVTVASVRKAVGAAALAAATKQIGAKAVRDIIAGIVGETPALKKQFADGVKSTADATLSNAEIRALNKRFGKGIIDQVRAGMKDQTPTAVQEAAAAAREIVKAMSDAVVTAKGNLRTAFGNLISAALSAFDEMASKWKPQALLDLEKFEIQEQKQALIDAINSAATDVQKARDDLALAVAEGDPEKIEAAKQKVIDAEKQLSTAQIAQWKAGQQALAAEQQAAHDAEMAKDRERLEKRLTAIQAKYLREKDLSKAEVRQMNKEIAAAMGEAGLDSKTAGQAISNQLAAGIREAMVEVRKAVVELANVLRKNLKRRSDPEEGPLSDMSTWWVGMGAALAAQISTEEVAAAAGRVGLAFQSGIIEPGTLATQTWGAMGVAKDTLITNLGLFVTQAGATGTAMQDNLIKPTEDWIARLMAAVQNTDAVGAALKRLDGSSATIFLYRKIITTNEGTTTTENTAGDLGITGDPFPGLAAGGIVRKRTLAWIGEKGAEAVVPLKSSGNMRRFASSLGEAMAAGSGSGGGGSGDRGPENPFHPTWKEPDPHDFLGIFEARGSTQTVNVHLHGSFVGNEQQLARVLTPAIRDQMRRETNRGVPSVIRPS